MEFNRNHYFIFGLVLLLAGVQLRLVETYVLNERASNFIAERVNHESSSEEGLRALIPVPGQVQRRTIRPPDWLGFALMSVGTVLVLHSLAMKKPGT